MAPPIPAMLVVAVTVLCVVAGLALRHSFRGRTVALLGIHGVMFVESLLPVLSGFYVDFLGQSPVHFARSSSSQFLPTFHSIELAIALAGMSGAACVALFLNSRKSCAISKVFPELRLLEAQVEVRGSASRLASLAGVAPPGVRLVDSGVPSAFTVSVSHIAY